MKRLIIIVALAMVMFWCSSAMALNTNDCPDWMAQQGWQCNGRIELSDMGHFSGDLFVWNNTDLITSLEAWNGPLDNLTPTREFQVNKGWLQIRNYATPDSNKVQTRVTVTAGVKVYAPVIWSVTCVSGDPNGSCPDGQETFFMDAEAPAGCFPNEFGQYTDQQQCMTEYPAYANMQNDCEMQPEYCGRDENNVPLCGDCNDSGAQMDCTVNPGPQLCNDELVPTGWNPADPDMNADPLVDPCCKLWPNRFEQVSFDPVDPTGVTVRWVEKNLTAQQYVMPYIAKFPGYALYPTNFWVWPDVGEWSEGVDYLADFYVLPDSTGPQNFEFMIDGVVQETVQYNVATLDPMPTVSATKEVDNETKFLIHGKEIKGGLKITWNDPPFKDIQKPGIQLRVYVGAYSPGQTYERFFWIDCPTQIHKMLVPMDQWQEMKDVLLATGATEASIAIIYRTMNNDFSFMNRGHSDSILIPLQ